MALPQINRSPPPNTQVCHPPSMTKPVPFPSSVPSTPLSEGKSGATSIFRRNIHLVWGVQILATGIDRWPQKAKKDEELHQVALFSSGERGGVQPPCDPRWERGWLSSFFREAENAWKENSLISKFILVASVRLMLRIHPPKKKTLDDKNRVRTLGPAGRHLPVAWEGVGQKHLLFIQMNY